MLADPASEPPYSAALNGATSSLPSLTMIVAINFSSLTFEVVIRPARTCPCRFSELSAEKSRGCSGPAGVAPLGDCTAVPPPAPADFATKRSILIWSMSTSKPIASRTPSFTSNFVLTVLPSILVTTLPETDFLPQAASIWPAINALIAFWGMPGPLTLTSPLISSICSDSSCMRMVNAEVIFP